MEETPRIIAEGFTRERAEELCRLLQAEGATVRVEPCQKY